MNNEEIRDPEPKNNDPAEHGNQPDLEKPRSDSNGGGDLSGPDPDPVQQ